MAGATVVSSSTPRRQNSTQWARWIEALARALQPASGRVDQIRSASGHRSDKRPPMSTIISAVLTVGLSRPFYPQLQTCRCTALTDAMCQKRKLCRSQRGSALASAKSEALDAVR